MSQNFNNKYLINHYNILQWNVRSITARLPSLQHLLTTHKCFIAILSETWLLPSRTFKLPYFKTFRFDRPDGYGGVAIAIHNSFKTNLIPIIDITRDRLSHHNIDLIGVEVLESDSSNPLKLWSCYIPNNINVPINLWQTIFNLVTRNSTMR